MPSVEIKQTEERPAKRVKTAAEFDSPSSRFATGLLDAESSDKYAQAYKDSRPYHHSLIPQLFQDELVRAVRTEIKSNLVFTEKETDIYKVNQTGDLANLDGLEGDELSKLSNVSKLRDALYSKEFRTFLRKVTGVGPLSGKKIDMSINNYTQGCHLLNHDDVIGTRSVSYILYLPDPDEPWLPEYGGALELYPVLQPGIPVDEPTLILPPSWNQFIMFAVQPGHSFHSVEEVVAPGKERLSISGWFHVAQEGEDGYMGAEQEAAREEEEKQKSTLLQLLETTEQDFTKYDEPELSEDEVLSQKEQDLLSKVLNPQYLQPKTLSQINDKFCEDSHISLSEILQPDFAQALQTILHDADAKDGISSKKMTPHGTGMNPGWRISGPPHRQRYMTLSHDANSPDQAARKLAEIETCLNSTAFRKWLSIVTSLTPVGRTTTTRRFRPGLDYTLATSNQQNVIEVNLCTTLPHEVWENGEVGGYSCYMAPHEDEDAAIYKSTTEDEDDGVLLTAQATWNETTIVMRDPGLLAFTKYVAVKAGASRWDVSAQYTFDAPDDENEDDDDEAAEQEGNEKAVN